MKEVMIMKKIFVLNNKKSNYFIEEYKSSFRVLPISALMNSSMQLIQEVLCEDNILIDISSLLNYAIINTNYVLIYETWINSLIHNNEDVQFASEDSVVDIALKLFPYYFIQKELLFEEVSEKTSEEITVEEKTTNNVEYNVPRCITLFSISSIQEFIKNKKEDGVNFISISELLIKNNA